MINRLGELVASGRLNADDVHIVLFEPELDDSPQTRTRIASFKEDGSLINWPFGFFQSATD